MANFASKRLSWFSRLDAGDSGRKGFDQTLPHLIEGSLMGDHGEALNQLKFDCWARFIAYPILPDDLLQKVTIELQALRQEAASLLQVVADCVRVNLFAPIGGALRIVPGATDNMDYAPEFDIRIEPNHGATGVAFATERACTVVQQVGGWTGNHLPGDELRKIHPRLKWVISLPVTSQSRGGTMGVVNIDGLDSIPSLLQNMSSGDSQAAVLALHAGMLMRFRPYLEAAFRGDHPEQLEA